MEPAIICSNPRLDGIFCQEVPKVLMSKQKGFTLIELLVVITIIGLLAAIALPNYIKAKDKAKEAEVKANCRTIEIALERYATDNDGSYPRFIWGGDELGWNYYFNNEFVSDPHEHGTETAIYDPLVLYNYVESYPRNPFVRDGKSVIYQTTAFDGELGQGDPRFGYSGTIMGNGLSDPRYPETDDTLGGADNGTWGGGETVTIAREPGQTWTMGGWWNFDRGKTVSSHWPGNFFYRSGGDMLLTRGLIPRTNDVAQHNFYPSGGPGGAKGDARLIVQIAKTDRYLLGGYGASRTIGYDALRMGDWNAGDEGGFAFVGAQDTDPIQYYQSVDNPGEESDNPIMFPEAMGKGENLNYPFWPYKAPENDSWLYASPDGSPDGVVLTLTAGSDSEKAGQ
jgi:prepilin-type N-terminal cleavage/methylation domain-containing protein